MQLAALSIASSGFFNTFPAGLTYYQLLALNKYLTELLEFSIKILPDLASGIC